MGRVLWLAICLAMVVLIAMAVLSSASAGTSQHPKTFKFARASQAL